MSTLVTHTGYEPALLKAARMEKTEGTPLWFMRQAGRVLPEYREGAGEAQPPGHLPLP